ncbi:MAG TPA: hypothetical protein IGS53_04270 [Leptolyngbyaceae cyanobacterium M33_DOE_097]|uniref:Uncharacterized protein n=1 Tax=Oscillatoriales cyanobacterium SpSt-418 TaxID=2282169 RepID=A0A7C3PJG7_9CYAN|nr:hypothetical protein [Leptolyngbyaceae cyanobacterium M33_DOE_097]
MRIWTNFLRDLSDRRKLAKRRKRLAQFSGTWTLPVLSTLMFHVNQSTDYYFTLNQKAAKNERNCGCS